MTDALTKAPEVKSADADATAAYDEFMQAFEAFKSANDERLDEIEKKVSADVVTTEKVERINRAMERSPVRWESWREMSKRLRFYSRTIQPMLAIANQVLHELDDALAQAQVGPADVPLLNSVVTRARGAALNVGAIRTVQQIDKLWKGDGAAEEVEHLRAAMVIELAAFDDAIKNRASQGEVPSPIGGTGHAPTPMAASGM